MDRRRELSLSHRHRRLGEILDATGGSASQREARRGHAGGVGERSTWASRRAVERANIARDRDRASLGVGRTSVLAAA